MHNPCSVMAAVAFVHKYQKDAELLAKQLDIPTENILGLAAHESQYGAGRIARECNNFFSMHAPAPLQMGEESAKGNTRIKVAKFSSFYQSGQSFIIKFGHGVKGKKDSDVFSKALITMHYNSGSAANGGRDGYAKLVKDAIAMVKARMSCPAQ